MPASSFINRPSVDLTLQSGQLVAIRMSQNRLADGRRWHNVTRFDLALRKQFAIREGMKLQVRLEAFNAFNRTRFDRANYRFGGGSFGQVDSLAGGFHARQMQVVARFEF